MNEDVEQDLNRHTVELEAANEALKSELAEHERAEQGLRLRAERFRRYFDLGLVGLAVTSPAKAIIEVNDEMCRMSGYDRSELLQKTWPELTHPDDLAADLTNFERVLAGDIDGYSMDKRFIRKDGQVVYASMSTRCLRGSDGSIEYFMAHVQDISERKRTEEQLRATSEELRALSASVRSAREEEGARIALELHDELGSVLSSLKWGLEGIERLLAPNEVSDVPSLRSQIAAMVRLTEATITTVKRISSELRPPILYDLGLASAIEWQAQRFQERTGISCALHCLADVDLEKETATAVFRIFQEAMTNVLRHANASRVAITMDMDGAALILEIRDDGRGISEQDKAGLRSLGLVGMRERAHLVGGKLEIQGFRGQGTVLTLRVPMAAPVTEA